MVKVSSVNCPSRHQSVVDRVKVCVCGMRQEAFVITFTKRFKKRGDLTGKKCVCAQASGRAGRAKRGESVE